MNASTNSVQDKGEILVVEDSPTEAESLKYLLEQEGFRITVAGDGNQALAHLGKHRPTLVITDIIMPGMDGYKVCEEIRSDASIPYVPVIFLTASQITQKDMVRGLDIGGDDYMRKPFDTVELFSRIRAALRVKELYDNLVRTKAELARYVSLSTLDMVEKSSSRKGIQNGKSRAVTVLFSDIRGFSQLAENMNPVRSLKP